MPVPSAPPPPPSAASASSSQQQQQQQKGFIVAAAACIHPADLPLLVPAVLPLTQHPLYSHFIVHGRPDPLAVSIASPSASQPPSATSQEASSSTDQAAPSPPVVDVDYNRLVQLIDDGDMIALSKWLASSPSSSNVNVDPVQAASGQTPIHYAAAKGLPAAVQVLIQHGAAIDRVDKAGETPLWKACYHGHVEVVKPLTAAGANPNYQDKQGWTPTHTAAARAHTAVVSWLLGHTYADVNIKNAFGSTPLMVAAAKGAVDIVRQLLDRGADPLIRNSLGECAYDIAAACSNVQTALLLESRNARCAEFTRVVAYEEKQKRAVGLLGKRWAAQPTNADWNTVQETEASVRMQPLPAGWFWLTDWSVDYMPTGCDESGWLYGDADAWTRQEGWASMTPSAMFRKRRHFRVMKRRVAAPPVATASPRLAANPPVATPQQQQQQQPPTNESSDDYLSKVQDIVGGITSELPRHEAHAKLLSSDALAKYTQAVEMLLIGVKNERDVAKQREVKQLISNYLSIAESLSRRATSSPAPDAQRPATSQPWMPDNLVTTCTQCARPFTLFLRRHHCRFCGKIFCSACSSKRISVRLLQRPAGDAPAHATTEERNSASPSVDSDSGSSQQRPRSRNQRPTELRVCDGCHQFLASPPQPSSSLAESIRRNPIALTERPGSASQLSSSPTNLAVMNSPSAPPGVLAEIVMADDSPSPSTSTSTDALPNPTVASLQDRPGLKRSESSASVNSLDECPFCQSTFPSSASADDREQHMLDCANTNVTPFTKKQRVRYIVQTMAEDSSVECNICFDTFYKGQEVARLSCLCTFHADCVRRWFVKHEFPECPFHIIA
ncbi:hypothetical protein RI367_003514 [Sorochytrium milnesiophthora]